MVSKDWTYKNIFNFSDDEIDDQKVHLINDLKDRFRYRSIEDEGNDPAMEPDPTDVEDELEELKTELKDKGGRPREGNTYGKDKHPYGRDPLGKKENQKALKNSRPREVRTAPTGLHDIEYDEMKMNEEHINNRLYGVKISVWQAGVHVIVSYLQGTRK